MDDDTPTSTSPRLGFGAIAATTAVAAVVALLVGFLLAGSDSGDNSSPGPDFELTSELDADETPSVAEALQLQFVNYDGTRSTLAEHRSGSPMVVNFFSVTCAPCVREMPDFEAVSQAAGDRLEFVGFAVVDRADEAQALVERTGVTYFTARDPNGDLIQAFQGIGMPTTALVDAEGRVVDVRTGAMDVEALTEWLADTFDITIEVDS